MKLTIYDGRYSFSEILDDDMIDIMKNADSFNIMLCELTPEMPCFGWLEMLQQSDIDLSFIDFEIAFIKYEKNIN